MNENDRNPAIRIHIDQQVFIDAILGAEEIEDATVVTEVVGFDRTETNYVLEGALTFTGYVQNQEQTQREVTAEDLLGDIVSSIEEDITVQQIHCRMPFTLEVPISAQRTEFINVTARVGTWNLHVLGPKWVHVRSELIVSGLTGADGYRFRCGTQEEGFAEKQLETAAGEYRVPEFGEFSQPSQYPQPSQFSQFPSGSNYFEQTTPYISPFATPSHPLIWDRNWPQPSISNTSQMQEQDNADHESLQEESALNQLLPNEAPLNEPSLQEAVYNGSLMRNEFSDDEAYSEQMRNETQASEMLQAEEVAEVANMTEAAEARVNANVTETIQVNQSNEVVEVSEPVEQRYAEEPELFYTRSASASDLQVEAEADIEEDIKSQSEADVEGDSVAEDVVDTNASFHFEEIAESSAIQNEPEFKLKIGSKKAQESSTFQAMSKLMEAGNAVRDEDGSFTNEPVARESSPIAQESSPSGVFTATGAESSPSSPSASISGQAGSPTVKEQSPTTPGIEIGEAVPVNTTIPAIQTPSPINFDSLAEPVYVQPAQPAPIDPALVMDGILPQVQQLQQDSQDAMLEKEVESKTVVDITITETPQASVTIADDKKYKQVEDRVYLWTELYPYLEESFRPMKFRIVQENDTLESIADNYRIPLSEVTRVNRLQSEHIDVGQLLYIPVRQ